jgi:hypothetical protein
MTPEERFDRLCEAFADDSGVSLPSGGRGFGSGGLRHGGRIFAMVTRGRLVVKLPAARVDALVAVGAGARFDANRGTPMKEWFTLDPDSDLRWEPLAREALAFVSAGPPGRPS